MSSTFLEDRRVFFSGLKRSDARSNSGSSNGSSTRDTLTTGGLLSLSLAISCRSPSFLSISVFSLVGHSLLSLSLAGNDDIFSGRKWPHPSPTNHFPYCDCTCHSDRQWHRCKVHNTESPNFFFLHFFYSCNNITSGLFVANTGLFVCLRFFFYIDFRV